jgi:hypothetical protein
MQNDPDRVLRELADSLAQRGLEAPARLMLDTVSPLGVLASQVALFVRPLLPNTRWRAFASALGHEESWHTLRRLLHPPDRP